VGKDIFCPARGSPPFPTFKKLSPPGLQLSVENCLLAVPLAYTYLDDLRKWFKQVTAIMLGRKTSNAGG